MSPQISDLEGRAAVGEDADHLGRSVLAQLERLAEVEALEAPADGLADDHLVGAGLGRAAVDDLHVGPEAHHVVGRAADCHAGDAVSAELVEQDHERDLADAVGLAVRLLLDVARREHEADLRLFDRARQLGVGALAHHDRDVALSGAAEHLLDAIGQHHHRREHEDDEGETARIEDDLARGAELHEVQASLGDVGLHEERAKIGDLDEGRLRAHELADLRRLGEDGAVDRRRRSRRRRPAPRR